MKYSPVDYYQAGRVYPRDSLREPFYRERRKLVLPTAVPPPVPGRSPIVASIVVGSIIVGSDVVIQLEDGRVV